jgi:hypothetical protein
MLARRYGLGKQLIDMAFGATDPAPPIEVTRVPWGGRRNNVRRDGFMSGDQRRASQEQSLAQSGG